MLCLLTVLSANSKSFQPVWNSSQRWKGLVVQHRKRTTAPSLLQHPRSDTESIDKKHCTAATLSFFPEQLISFWWEWLRTGPGCPARWAVQCPSLELYQSHLDRLLGSLLEQGDCSRRPQPGATPEPSAWRNPRRWISHTSWLSQTFGLRVCTHKCFKWPTSSFLEQTLL